MTTFGERLKAARHDLGLSQGDLAEKCYTDRNTISKYECDKRYPMSSMRKALADALMVDERWLVKGVRMTTIKLQNLSELADTDVMMRVGAWRSGMKAYATTTSSGETVISVEEIKDDDTVVYIVRDVERTVHEE